MELELKAKVDYLEKLVETLLQEVIQLKLGLYPHVIAQKLQEESPEGMEELEVNGEDLKTKVSPFKVELP